MTGALEGIRVIEFAQMFAGPGTGMYLADQGADVIRVEPPTGGRDRADGELTDTFLLLNRGKRSLALDIRGEAGHAIVHSLVRLADIMLVAWPPGQAERLGYEYARMRALNPRLIYASITGWGTTGPRAAYAGYDRLQQAYTGIMHRNQLPDGTPAPLPFFVADLALPMLLGYGIMLALWARERTGAGQHVEVSQLMAQIAMQSIDLVFGKDVGAAPDTLGKWGASFVFRTQDGLYLTLMPITNAEWAAVWATTDLPDLAADPRLRTRPGREAAVDTMRQALAARFAGRPRADWIRALEAAGVPAAPVLTSGEFIQEEHVRANDMVSLVEHPIAGARIMMSPPVRLSATPARIGRPAPLLGEHTAEVLQTLGYDDDTIAELLAAGVVVSARPRP